MTEAQSIEIIKKYLANHKYTPVTIDPNNRTGKRPDLEVKENDDLKFYCEVKTPEHILKEKHKCFIGASDVEFVILKTEEGRIRSISGGIKRPRQTWLGQTFQTK
jgi:hypothetical protein